MRSWIKQHKKQLLQLALTFAVGVAISLLFLLVFCLTGVITFDGGFSFNAELFESLKGNPWIYIVYLLVEAIGCAVLCMSPAGSGVFVWLGIALFGANWKCFLVVLAGCLLSYMIIDAMGRFGGSKMIIRIFGKDEYDRIVNLINTKGILYALIIYTAPLFPDDFCCLVFGSIKMKWWLHMLFALIGKSVGIATVVFGVSLIPTELFIPFSMDKIYNYFVLGGCLIAYVTVLFRFFRWANAKIGDFLEKRRERKENEQADQKRE